MIWMLIRRLSKKPIYDVPLLLIYLNGGFLAIQLMLILK